MSYKSFGAVALLATLLAPGAAMAASAIATTNVNLRAGPSTEYPAVNVVGAGHGVTVYGCLSSRSWCDVSYAGQRGWMSSNYLAFVDRGRRYTGANAVTALHAPVVTFSFGKYWDSHYRGRPFYRERDRWEHRDFRDDRRDVREEQRERRDARQDLREERRDVRDARKDLREERRDVKDVRKRFEQDRRN